MRRLYGTLLASLALLAAADPVRSQPPPQASAERLTAGQFVGPASCASGSCHGRSTPSAETEVLQNEYSTWVHRDPHFRAHEGLYTERAETIARNLGSNRPPADDPQCLACHALVVTAPRQAQPIDVADGVSCESCHGPAGGWLDQHPQREWTYADSLDAGMIDLRSSRTRSAVCNHCHFGSARHDLGHQLLAAGHPELTFELDNFSEAMPSHWRSFVERPQAALSPAALWSLGQIESLRASLGRVARGATGGQWPELADLSCDDCHHTLTEERWRRPRSSDRPLGMPRWSPARWAMLRHIVAELASERLADLEADVARLAELLGDLRSPRTEVHAAADDLLERLEELRRPVRRARWDRARLDRLMAAIAADRDYLADSDRQSAEQAALAIQSLYSSLLAASPSLAEGPVPGMIDELFDALQEPYAYRPEIFIATLEKLEQQVR